SSREGRKRDDRLADRPGPQHRDRFAEPQLGHVHGVERGHESAAAADERLRRQLARELDHLHARLHPDRLGPSAEETVARAVTDAVDFARGTARGLPRDETLVAVVAGFIDVEEGDDVAFFDAIALDVAKPAGGLG